jgi:hypothetical protein
VEPSATNLVSNSAQFDNFNKTGCSVIANSAMAPDGALSADTITFIENSGNNWCSWHIGSVTGTYTLSVFVNTADRVLYAGGGNAGYEISFDVRAVGGGIYRQVLTFVITSGNLDPLVSPPTPFTLPYTLAAWGMQLETGTAATSYIPTTTAPASRAADVIAPGAGLVFSNVPITEAPYSVATSYAKDALVYDPTTYLTYQSAVAGNMGHPLTDAASWTPLKKVVNRRLMFDKVVNSQTSAANEVTVVIQPGELVNTLGLLNVEGSSVTVTQMDSGYSQTKSLVSHDPLSWYDFFYTEPIREGDVIFDGIPPYAGSALSISVINPGADAAIGCCILGRARTIGQTAWDFTGGILSYSSSSADTFGNVTMVKRDNSKVLNFEVYIPRGFESAAYRLLAKEYTDVEIMIIGAEDYSMTFAYGFLGQWSVPVTNSNKTAHIEFKGLA